MDYDTLINRKALTFPDSGFAAAPFTAPMKPFQQIATAFALQKGRAALFEDTGLGKSRQALEWGLQVLRRTGKPVLILTKLAVCPQFIREADAVGIPAIHIRTAEALDDARIYVMNYEKMDALQEAGIFDRLGGIVLDESSILKNFTGKMSGNLRAWCQGIPYRLCATATPAPNDWDELGQHAEFLGVMSSAQMLATWFINDTGDTGTWRLKKHARADFWRWVSTWAACIFKPSDVGDSDEGYDLPPLHIHEERFKLPEKDCEPQEGMLFDMTVVNATNQAREAKRTIQERSAWIAGRVSHSERPWCVFVETDAEADSVIEELKRHECDRWAEVRGSDDAEEKARLLYGFAIGEVRVMVTKCKIAGFGLNWQHCANVIFASPSYSFEQWYQAVRRFYRFGQASEVQCWMLRGENMERVADVWRQKMIQFDEMKSEMRTASAHLAGERRKGMGCNTAIKKKEGANWTLYHGDCVRVAKTLPHESIDFSVFSPPFADLFTYSDDAQDMGNCVSLEAFMVQFRFLIRELMRLTTPGRHCAVHCVDLLATKWKDGYMGYKNFSGKIVDAFMEEGWILWSRVTIWKCPVVEMTRTKAHGLLHRTIKKDSASSRVGSAEYLLVFRKPGENPKPITHTPEAFPVSLWQEIASPVWMTVDQSDTLNGMKGYQRARGAKDEKHICPLQLGVIQRALMLWSAPGDMVFSPFLGIGSEGFESVKAGRRFIGAELKPEYFKEACRNLAAAESEKSIELFPV
jgi:DNA modification methylase